jgi:hypothetical protein
MDDVLTSRERHRQVREPVARDQVGAEDVAPDLTAGGVAAGVVDDGERQARPTAWAVRTAVPVGALTRATAAL